MATARGSRVVLEAWGQRLPEYLPQCHWQQLPPISCYYLSSFPFDSEIFISCDCCQTGDLGTLQTEVQQLVSAVHEKQNTNYKTPTTYFCFVISFLVGVGSLGFFFGGFFFFGEGKRIKKWMKNLCFKEKLDLQLYQFFIRAAFNKKGWYFLSPKNQNIYRCIDSIMSHEVCM